ncbi:MAG: peptidylprolyl isomerase [Proteobacteria bacterium]|nr:peptidylprolyl isomerase [Pseudomonadota bacterium]
MNPLIIAALLAAAPAPATFAAAAPPPADGKALVSAAPGPSEIVATAPAGDWVAIAPQDLLVMDLAADAKGRPRRVVIQLMPAPFSQGWVGNIRKLAAAHWWDGMAVTRVQDNYVAQWGDPEADDPAKAKKLPAGLAVVGEEEYEVGGDRPGAAEGARAFMQQRNARFARVASLIDPALAAAGAQSPDAAAADELNAIPADPYASLARHWHGWPVASDGRREGYRFWPVHCYGMVGVGRNLSPDTGSGAELYAVIGHAPRHLDRNIALVGRVIEGIEHLSSLPRGHGPLGFYDTALGDERVPISAVRLGSEVAGLPAYQYLSTESASFARYADARANRHDAFFIRPAGGADICNVPVPVRRAK